MIRVNMEINSKKVPFEDKAPVIKTIMYFDSKYKPEEMAELLYTTEKRTSWDKSSYFEEISKISHNLMTYYTVYQGVMFVKDREFVEKRMLFMYDGSIYTYFSSAPNEVSLIYHLS